jgi:hypothetical protein
MPGASQRLRAKDFEARLARLGAYFVNDSPIQNAAHELAKRFEELGIDYAVAGAIALAAHGLVRATEDLDVLLSGEDLARFKQAWLGRGYAELRAGGKAMRDTRHNVKIDFLITGEFPGDGRPKPVAFPEPKTASEAVGAFRVLTLPRLVELKLASGMTAPHRLQDLADVQRLIGVRQLPRETVEQLDPYVRAKFDELWLTMQREPDDY